MSRTRFTCPVCRQEQLARLNYCPGCGHPMAAGGKDRLSPSALLDDETGNCEACDPVGCYSLQQTPPHMQPTKPAPRAPAPPPPTPEPEQDPVPVHPRTVVNGPEDKGCVASTCDSIGNCVSEFFKVVGILAILALVVYFLMKSGIRF